MMSRRNAVLLALTLVAGTSSPMPFSGELGLGPTPAVCQNGTCCRQKGATCVVGEIQNPGYYLKDGPGACPTAPTEPLPPP